MTETYNEFDDEFLYQYVLLSSLEDKNMKIVEKGKEVQIEKNVEKIKFECKICCVNYTEEEGVYLNCEHFFCRECIENHIKNSVDENQTIRCPEPDCDKMIMTWETRCFLNEKYQEKLERQELERTLNQGAIPCPTPNCTNRFFIDETFLPSKDAIGSLFGKMIVCEVCFCSFCSACKETFHYHTTCKEYKMKKAIWEDEKKILELKKKIVVEKDPKKDMWGNVIDKEIKLNHKKKEKEVLSAKEQFIIDEIWKEKNCRHCPNCYQLIEKINGCDNMCCGSDNPYEVSQIAQNGCGKKFLWSQAIPYQTNYMINDDNGENEEDRANRENEGRKNKEANEKYRKRKMELGNLRVIDLKDILREKSLPVSGIKITLIERILKNEGLSLQSNKRQKPIIKPIMTPRKNCMMCEKQKIAIYRCLHCDDIFSCEECIYHCIQHDHQTHVFDKY